MLRRLHPEQPESFAFTPANQAWAEAQLKKYPEGRQASAIIPLLWRAQEQEGWLTRAAIEHVAQMLGLAYMRALEVATFYFMFQLQPVGTVAHFQICGTTSCMLCGSEDLIAVCRDKIAPTPHTLSGDGKFSWEEVECLGACANAPMAQIGKDYYEDLTPDGFEKLIDAMARGEVPRPGPQNSRIGSEPEGGLTSLTDGARDHDENASVALARVMGDTLKRIDGTEAADAGRNFAAAESAPSMKQKVEAAPERKSAVAATSQHSGPEDKAAQSKAAPVAATPAEAAEPTDEDKPDLYTEAPDGGGDDLKKIKGVGPKLEGLLHQLGVWRFAQIASWSDREVAWVDEHLEGFKGRIERDGWVAQARTLAAGDTTEFAQRVEKGEVPSSEG